MKQTLTAVLLLLLALAAVSALAQVSAGFDLSWSVFSGGGGSRQATAVHIDDILGQGVDGRARSARFQIDPGFWHALPQAPPPVTPPPVSTPVYVPAIFNPGS